MADCVLAAVSVDDVIVVMVDSEKIEAAQEILEKKNVLVKQAAAE